MARRRRSLLGNNSSAKGTPPQFGAITPPAEDDGSEGANSVSVVSETDARASDETGPLPPEQESQESYATAETLPAAEAPAAEAFYPEEDDFKEAFHSVADLPEPVSIPPGTDPADAEVYPAGASTPTEPRQSSGRFFDVADLPAFDSTTEEEPERFEADSGEWESSTLDDVFSFEDYPTDVPEDPALAVNEALTERITKDPREESSPDSDYFRRPDTEPFAGDDFSDLQREETDIPEDPALLQSILAELGAGDEAGSDTLVPQELDSSLRGLVDEENAFSASHPIPEDEETIGFQRDALFNFKNDETDEVLGGNSTGNSLPPVGLEEIDPTFDTLSSGFSTSSASDDDGWGFDGDLEDTVSDFFDRKTVMLEGHQSQSEGASQGDTSDGGSLDSGFGGFGDFGELGDFGDDLPPTEEVPAAVLEDLASPHYASSAMHNSFGFGDLGDTDSVVDPDEELAPPPAGSDYTLVVVALAAIAVGIGLALFLS